MRDDDVRAALTRHWTASDANDFEAEHEIYCEEAVLEYPQSALADPRPTQHPGVAHRATECEAGPSRAQWVELI